MQMKKFIFNNLKLNLPEILMKIILMKLIKFFNNLKGEPYSINTV